MAAASLQGPGPVRMAMRALAFFVVLAALLAGCSGDPGVVPEKDAEGRYVIHLTAANQFDPKDARIPVGATVAWAVDAGMHDVNADDGSFSSNEGRPVDANGHPTLLAQGETFTFTFDEAGTWHYWCHTHHELDMEGTIRVK